MEGGREGGREGGEGRKRGEVEMSFPSEDEEIIFIEFERDESGFGFSIRGGAEYNAPLCVLRIAEAGAAEKNGRLKVSSLLKLFTCMCVCVCRLVMSYWKSMETAQKECCTLMLLQSLNTGVAW